MTARIAVAYSGGRDSTALLHATLKAAAQQGIEVLALHVHHGLSLHADAWEDDARHQCQRWARRGWPVRFHSYRLTTRPLPGDSLEAWARQARYRALRAMAIEHGASAVMLAHHRRDQAETFLLQALRSAGVAGLSGMPAEIEREGVVWLRPWLHVSSERIDAYVRRHRLRHVDDDSNDDTRFARNRMRHHVWPELTAAFPHAEAALADAAAWAQEAAACLRELAAIDLAAMATEQGLDLKRWSSLSAARRSNLLREWLRSRTGRAASASTVVRLMGELHSASTGTWPIEGGVLHAYRGLLRHEAVAVERASDGVPAFESTLSVRRAGRIELPGWGGSLQVQRVAEGGVPLAWLAQVELKPRRGGEQFQSGVGRPPRSLKKQYQAAAVPAWERDGPLLYRGGQLIYVPGLGIDARVMAPPGQPQVTLRWLPSRAQD